MDSCNSESVNAWRHNGVRPKCRCCGGGKVRKGYKSCKSVSARQSVKSKMSKPKSKDHR